MVAILSKTIRSCVADKPQRKSRQRNVALELVRRSAHTACYNTLYNKRFVLHSQIKIESHLGTPVSRCHEKLAVDLEGQWCSKLDWHERGHAEKGPASKTPHIFWLPTYFNLIKLVSNFDRVYCETRRMTPEENRNRYRQVRESRRDARSNDTNGVDALYSKAWDSSPSYHHGNKLRGFDIGSDLIGTKHGSSVFQGYGHSVSPRP
jgi:hypothetical protein